MAKTSPYSLRLSPVQVLDRVFDHFSGSGHRFACSCGFEFSPANAFQEEAVCPNDLDKKKPEDHVVTKREAALSFALKLKVLGNLDVMAAQSMMDDLGSKYVSGYGDPGKPGYKAPELMAPVSGRPVIPSAMSIQAAVILYMAQLAEPQDEYTVEELLAFMSSDSMCYQMGYASGEVQEGASDSNPLALRAPTVDA